VARRRRSGEGGPVVVRIVRFADLVDVGNAYRSGRVVDLMLDASTSDTRRRAIDFVSGLAYGVGGDVEKVDEQHFRLIPFRSDPDGSADDREPLEPAPVRGDGAAALTEPPGDWESGSTSLLPSWPGPNAEPSLEREAVPQAH
jgi:Cell division protein SepF